jgi:antitoxin (DNA-binding transcriptional repressor) of toxin-antitoxin stability system
VYVNTISIRGLRASLASLSELLERDGELVVTRQGRPLAKLVPFAPGRTAPSHADLRAGMPDMGVPSEDPVRAERLSLLTKVEMRSLMARRQREGHRTSETEGKVLGTADRFMTQAAAALGMQCRAFF